MEIKKLKAGDLFVSKSKGIIPTLIRAVEWWWSTDNEATYNHAGVIVGPSGVTLEARWRFKYYHLHDQLGNRILIARHKDMTPLRAAVGFATVAKDIGNIYPVFRLFLHLFKVAKVFAYGPGVCSEQTGKFMKGAGFNNIVYGITPDDLADKWRIDKDMDIIFDGILNKDVLDMLTVKVDGGAR